MDATYSRYAERCRRQSAAASDEDERTDWLNMAKIWDELASDDPETVNDLSRKSKAEGD